MSPRALAPFALALAFTVTLTPSLARAWCQATTVAAAPGASDCTVAGYPLAWPQRCVGLSLHVDGSLTMPFEELEPLVDRVLLQWSRVACDPPGTRTPTFQMLRVARTFEPVRGTVQGPNANTVFFDAVWAPDPRHSPFTIAVTRRRSLPGSGSIYDADIEFNERSDDNPYGYVFVSDPAILTSYTPDQLDMLGVRDLHTVFLHEAGHVLGLGHSADPDAIMFAEIESTQRPQRVVTTDDVAGVCALYPPDGPLEALECNTTPRGGFAGEGPSLTGPTCACRALPAPPASRSAPLALVGAALLARFVRARRRSPR